MKQIFLSLAGLIMGAMLAVNATTVTYTADNQTIFSNPERGFITEVEEHVSQKHPYAVKGEESYLSGFISSDKMSLILVMYYLDEFRNVSQLPSWLLSAFDEDMQVLRNLGLKCVLRFAYTQETYDNKGKESGKDATLSIVQSHISQYKSHWQANADVIFAFQAGFVGTWGEWYYTDNFGNQQSTINDSRRAVIDALLDAVPGDRYIQIRTPLFKTGYVGDTKPLTAEEAYSDLPKARLGHHNDAFLYGATNQGTYQDTAKQKPYIAKETLYVPIGGESNIESDEDAAKWASYTATINEMSRLHWTFISGVYAPQVTNLWRNSSTFDELNRRLGYRLQLVSGEFSSEAWPGGKLSVNLQIRNTGFAPLYNARPAYIVLQGTEQFWSLPLQSDPRTWLPNGEITTINEQLTLPADLPMDDYRILLWLPDAYETLASDPRYAVRFANTGVWNAESGMNDLGATVTIGDQPYQPGDPVQLPATLNKANVNAYSENMAWHNTNYFDFGPEDAPNTDRWAEWKVRLLYPGNYIVSATGYYPNGHQWQLSLLQSGAADYALPATWASGNQTETGDTKWNLSGVKAGTYMLRIGNIMEWGQPKLLNIKLQYDGELPTGINIPTTNDQLPTTCQYDILGRPVNGSYHGIIITPGKKYLR